MNIRYDCSTALTLVTNLLMVIPLVCSSDWFRFERTDVKSSGGSNLSSVTGNNTDTILFGIKSQITFLT